MALNFGTLLFLAFLFQTLDGASFQMPICVGPPRPVEIKAPFSPTLQQALDDLTTTFAQLVSANHIPALSANLIVGDNIIWSQGFGKKNLSDPHSGAPNGSTVFRIGSVTKTLTELQLLQLRDQGVINLDDPLTKYLPSFSVRNPYSSRRQITLRQLAGHKSGLLKDPPCEWAIGDCNYTTQEMLGRISTQMLLYPPDTQQSYSNTGITLLARALETVTNKTWEEALVQSILSPLGMRNTNSYFLPRFRSNFAVGYSGGAEAPQIELAWFRPTGNAYSTTDDLAKLISLLFQYDNYQISNPILDAMTLREWTEIVALRAGNTLGMSHPWETFGWGNYTLLTKNGGVTGYAAEIGFIPELKIGFTILQSTSDGGFSGNWGILANFLLNVLEPEIWNLQPPPALPNDIDQFAGTYTNGKDSINITVGPYGSHGYKHILLLGWEATPVLILDWLDVEDTFQMSLRGLPHVCILPSGGYLSMVRFGRNRAKEVIKFELIGNLYLDSWAEQVFWKGGVPKTNVLKKVKPQKKLGLLNPK